MYFCLALSDLQITFRFLSTYFWAIMTLLLIQEQAVGNVKNCFSCFLFEDMFSEHTLLLSMTASALIQVACYFLNSRLTYSSTIRMKVLNASETSADFHWTTRSYIAVHITLHSFRCKNLRSCRFLLLRFMLLDANCSTPFFV
jgi:hypothetical protein